jgi:hypothetical protein
LLWDKNLRRITIGKGEDALRKGGALASPVTAYIYDWNLQAIIQRLPLSVA